MKKAFQSIIEDKKAAEHILSMGEHCKKEDSHMLEELNIEEAETAAKEEEALTKHHSKPV